MSFGLFAQHAKKSKPEIQKTDSVKKDSVATYFVVGNAIFWGDLFEKLRENGKRSSLEMNEYIETISKHLIKYENGKSGTPEK